MKAADYIGGPNDTVLIPPTPTKTDYAVNRGDKGKNCETFHALGPVLVASDEIPVCTTL